MSVATHLSETGDATSLDMALEFAGDGLIVQHASCALNYSDALIANIAKPGKPPHIRPRVAHLSDRCVDFHRDRFLGFNLLVIPRPLTVSLCCPIYPYQVHLPKPYSLDGHIRLDEPKVPPMLHTRFYIGRNLYTYNQRH